MSEFTKGEMKFTSGRDKGWWVKLWLNQICIATMQGVYQDDAIVIAKELVRRWNAFEDGGLVDELKVACDIGLDAMNALLEIDIKLNSKNKKSLKETIKFAEAALAKS